MHIKEIRKPNQYSKPPKKEYLKLIFLFFIIAIISFLIIFLLAIGLTPSLLSGIPIVINMLIMTMIMVIYGCFAALFLGLKDVVRAGGSATEVVKTLSSYISDAMNVNDMGDQNKSQQQNSGTKDGSGAGPPGPGAV
jgi:hypothetical protein